VPGAFHRASLFVELTLRQGTVIVRTAILDRIQVAAAVEHADFQVLPLDQAALAGLKLVYGAHFDEL
jgi:hypothetical protein